MLSVTMAGNTAAGRRLAGFYVDVINGLRAENKYLQSKYFYDETGDKLFQQIMASPEYYPTRCEMEIFQEQSGPIAACLQGEEGVGKPGAGFDLIELGPGDATKSHYLLRELLKQRASFTYYPIDISSNVIGMLDHQLPISLPGLEWRSMNGEYLDQLEKVAALSPNRKVLLFMGANIGNMTQAQAVHFCRELHERMLPGDLLLIGFDLKKDPRLILDAYNDRQGYTREFNLNLLRRINRELCADFDPDLFEHYPVYDPGSGACKSYLISRVRHQVHIGSWETIEFQESEPIYMEISQKYALKDTEQLAAQSGFAPLKSFFDSRHWFADILWQRLP